MFFVNNSVKLISKIVIIVTVIVFKNTFILIFVVIIFSLLYSCLNLINFIAIIGFILEVNEIIWPISFLISYQQYLIHLYQFYSLRFLRHRSYSLKLIVKGSFSYWISNLYSPKQHIAKNLLIRYLFVVFFLAH